jgi:hypothetical protein
MCYQLDFASVAKQPGYNLVWVRDATAKQQELGFWRGERQDELVVSSPDWIRQQLVFINDQELGTFSA